MDDFSCIAKYKGLENNELQVRASFSQDTGHVICGSEDQNVYIWQKFTEEDNKKDKSKRKKAKTNDEHESFKGILFIYFILLIYKLINS